MVIPSNRELLHLIGSALIVTRKGFICTRANAFHGATAQQASTRLNKGLRVKIPNARITSVYVKLEHLHSATIVKYTKEKLVSLAKKAIT